MINVQKKTKVILITCSRQQTTDLVTCLKMYSCVCECVCLFFLMCVRACVRVCVCVCLGVFPICARSPNHNHSKHTVNLSDVKRYCVVSLCDTMNIQAFVNPRKTNNKVWYTSNLKNSLYRFLFIKVTNKINTLHPSHHLQYIKVAALYLYIYLYTSIDCSHLKKL